jgi:hypothetical protein
MDRRNSSHHHSGLEGTPRLTPARWFERVVAALFWGWVWSSVVAAGWATLPAVAYGDIGRASELMMGKAWDPFALSAAMASMLGSFIGAFVGPLAIGAASARVRRPVVLSSLLGATSGAVIGALAGCAAEWVSQLYEPRSMLGMCMAIVVSLPVGLFGGWYGGRAVLGNRVAAGGPAERTV